MFCPQCGQRQISNEARFCSGCGFSLNVVSELLPTGGQLPWRPPSGTPKVLTPRGKGIRQGAMLMVSTLSAVVAAVSYDLPSLNCFTSFAPLLASLASLLLSACLLLSKVGRLWQMRLFQVLSLRTTGFGGVPFWW